MSIEIDVLNGDASWPLAEPLFKAVWPPEVVEKLPWGRFAVAYPEWRVLVQSDEEGVISHVGIQRREVTWNGRKMQAGGIGGVVTREDKRRRGYASVALNAAIQTFPAVLFAVALGFTPRDFFDLGADRAAASTPPPVKF